VKARTLSSNVPSAKQIRTKQIRTKQVSEVRPNPVAPVSQRDFALGLLLLCAIATAYFPALNGGPLWDDSSHVTSTALQSFHGLWRIWFELGATQQYYPLLHTAFWVEHRFWGDTVLGYHLTNITLHALSSFLVVAIMRRLSLPGAWLAGFIFALHPVCTESVAWISEQKNTLSTVFYLSSALCYLGFDPRFDNDRKSRSRYFAALALYAMALLTKSVTATLPVTLLIVLWWERGRLTWKRDVMPLLPWLGVGAASGALTAWVERTYIGAAGASFDLTIVQRFLLAGRVIWFYLGKLFWPSNLIFIYPHWDIDTGAAWQYAFPLGALALAGALWAASRSTSPRIPRGAFAGFLCFTAALVPALGFVNVYPFIYSYVADHFQYQACLGIIIPCAAGMTLGIARLPANLSRIAPVAASLLLATLGWLTWQQSTMYRDSETLYRETIARNPASWMAYDNLGIILAHRAGGESEAARLFEKALEVRPGYADAHLNLGSVLFDMPGRRPEAIANYREAVRLSPGVENYHASLASALAEIPGGLDDAVAEYQSAIRLQPGDASAHYALANVLAQAPDQLNNAIAEYRATISIQPDYAEAHMNLGSMLLRTPGGVNDAVAEFREALRIRPHYAEAHYNLGTVLSDMPGRTPEAIAEYEAALRDRPDYPEAHCNLGIALADIPGRLPDAIEQFQAALRTDPNMYEAQYAWGMALVDLPGRRPEAIAHFKEALRARPDFEPARQILGTYRAATVRER
jgi:tetratricopeptide (TPR) repeat protein